MKSELNRRWSRVKNEMIEDDPTITRIRKSRHSISEKFGHDPGSIVEYYVELQKKHNERFVETLKTGKRTFLPEE